MLDRRLRKLTAMSTLAVAAVAASHAPGQATQPAPASQAAAHVAPDPATPKGALRLLADGMEAGDRGKILGVLHASNPTEEQMAAAMADLARSIAALRESAVAAYGAEGAKRLTGDTAAANVQAMQRLAAATVSEQGDRATVTLGEAGEPPVVLVRAGGQWKFPVSELARGKSDADVRQSLTDAADQAKLFVEAADDVKQGKYKTGEEARQALDQRIMQMAMRGATRPSTAPAASRPAR